jgi:hypothetical protein
MKDNLNITIHKQVYLVSVHWRRLQEAVVQVYDNEN